MNLHQFKPVDTGHGAIMERDDNGGYVRAHDAEQALHELRMEIALMKSTWTSDDQPLPEDEAISESHPLNSKQFKVFDEAVRLVSAKRSKYALVGLVGWLLSRIDRLEKERLSLTSIGAVVADVIDATTMNRLQAISLTDAVMGAIEAEMGRLARANGRL
jgi:hypothetical protein